MIASSPPKTITLITAHHLNLYKDNYIRPILPLILKPSEGYLNKDTMLPANLYKF